MINMSTTWPPLQATAATTTPTPAVATMTTLAGQLFFFISFFIYSTNKYLHRLHIQTTTTTTTTTDHNNHNNWQMTTMVTDNNSYLLSSAHHAPAPSLAWNARWRGFCHYSYSHHMRRQQKPAQTMVIHCLGHRYSFFLLFICLSILLTYVSCLSRLYLHVALPSLTSMLQFMEYNINQYDASKGETYRLAKEFGQYQRSD